MDAKKTVRDCVKVVNPNADSAKSDTITRRVSGT